RRPLGGDVLFGHRAFETQHLDRVGGVGFGVGVVGHGAVTAAVDLGVFAVAPVHDHRPRVVLGRILDVVPVGDGQAHHAVGLGAAVERRHAQRLRPAAGP